MLVEREDLGSRVSDPVIHVSELSRRFGAKTALASVSLSMPRGAVYGLVGANGAGKTTLIRHILGLLRAESGSVRVFGLDPVADPVGVLSRIGYLSEENDLPGWMRARDQHAWRGGMAGPAEEPERVEPAGRARGVHCRLPIGNEGRRGEDLARGRPRAVIARGDIEQVIALPP